MAQTDLRKYGTEERLNKMDLDVISVDPTCDPSGTDDADVLFDFTEIPYAASVDGGSCLLHSIQLLDDDDVGGKLDLVFATANTALGALDAAITISDANAQNILGYVSAEGTRSLYVAGVNRNGASVTHVAAGIHLKIGIVKD